MQNRETGMRKQPLVSVVIPCINRAHLLKPTIDSVLKQDYPHIECIVVDGGSIDGTIEILKRYGNRIKWVSEPDDGHADAINKGWRMSTGEVLAWLNADDLWAVPNAASQAVAYLQAHPEVDVVYGDCGSIDAEGDLVGMSYLHEWDLEYAVEHCDHCIPQPAAFIRRRILEKVGWLDTAFYQKKDHELWLRIGLEGRIEYIPVLLAYARNIKGLSYEGKTAASSCIQVTKKFYSLPNLTPYLKHKKRRAFSNSYLRGMDYAFAGGRLWKIIFGHAFRAALVDPTNVLNTLRRLHRYVVAGSAEDRRFQWALIGLKSLSLSGRVLHKGKRWVKGHARPHTPNLLGDRDIEWSWIASQMPAGPGEALDFGSGGSHLALIAAKRGFNVTAVDLEPVQWPYVHPRLHFILGDILKLPLRTEHFDLIINCSTVEHVGIAGRYAVTRPRPDGDLEAMAHLRQLMKPGGVMLLTIPIGQDAVFTPLCRVYGVQRLPRLLDGYTVESKVFWVKDGMNRWTLCDKDTALKFKSSMSSWNVLENTCALGCFVLKRPERQVHSLI